MSESAHRPFHVLANPVGSLCNLDCKYCYYLEKERLYAHPVSGSMSDEVLREFISQYIRAQRSDEVSFLWQGGEPTLAGLDFFRKVVALQSSLADGKRISNALQTNGTLITDEFAEFLAEHEFLVGISLDGPAELHDPLRPTKGGSASQAETVRGLRLLQKAGVNINILCVVHKNNVVAPETVYDYLTELGGRFLQFLPLVEYQRVQAGPGDLDLATPGTPNIELMSSSVAADQYGEFLCRVFDRWESRDIGRVFVQLFDVTLENWLGIEPSLCIFRTTCGDAVALEKNGDVYACDHFVFPDYLLGNITQTPLQDLVASPSQQSFGQAKHDALPQACKNCDVYFACKGECPKNRFLDTDDGEPGLNYLCQGYMRFFRHVAPSMNRMASAITPGFSPRKVRPQSASS